MKTTVKVEKKSERYPRLGISIKNKFVVLFSGLNVGTVIDSGLTCWPVGYYCDNWYMETFDFETNLVVTLES